MKSFKKIIAAVLVALMATGLMAGMAFADDTAFDTKTKTYSEAIESIEEAVSTKINELNS